MSPVQKPIHAAAICLFAQQYLAEVSLREVAPVAGMARGTSGMSMTLGNRTTPNLIRA